MDKADLVLDLDYAPKKIYLDRSIFVSSLTAHTENNTHNKGKSHKSHGNSAKSSAKNYTRRTHTESKVNNEPIFIAASTDNTNRITVSVSIGSTEAKSLYDTGAGASVMAKRIFLQAVKRGLPFKELTTASLHSVTGERFPVYKTVRFVTTILGKKINSVWHISDAIAYDAVIGMTIIKDRLEYVNGSVRWREGLPSTIVATLGAPRWHTGAVFPDTHRSSVTIQPGMARKIRIRVKPEDGAAITSGDAFVEVNNLAGIVSLDEKGSASIFVQNTKEEEITLHRGQAIGFAWQADDKAFVDAESMFKSTDMAVSAISKTSSRKHNQQTDAQQERHWKTIEPVAKQALQHLGDLGLRKRMMSVIKKYATVFSADKFDVGRSDEITHTIRLKTEEPVFTKQFPLPDKEMEFIKEHVRQWLKLGLVEGANSPYNSPIFCVAKKGDTGKRMVLDYRRLNAQSHIDYYSIRSVEECLNEVGRAASKCFSALDLTSGFWQLPLDPKVKHTTAFTVPGMGQYQWLMAPMGLQGSPASFSRLMDKVLLDVPNCVTFIDDVLVHSSTRAEHPEHLETVLSRFAKAGLKLNLPKCQLARESVPYLGHTLSAEGVSPGEDKFKALTEKAPPRDIPSVKSFLGLANFFRKFVANFSEKQAPLSALTRADSNWSQGDLPPKAREAFEQLKRDITSAPTLALPRRAGTFHLFTDASSGSHDGSTEGGMGACLLQEQKGKFLPIAFASRVLKTAERNYSAFLLEKAAATYAIEHFHHLLRGNRFYLYVDQKPLADKLNALSPIHLKTLNRLEEKQTEYEFDTRYTPGGHFNPADFLSRNVTTAEHICALNEEITTYTPTSWRDFQEQDAEIKLVKAALAKEGQWPPRFRKIAKQMAEENGIVGFYLKPRRGFARDKRFRILPPASMYKTLLQQAHDEATRAAAGKPRPWSASESSSGGQDSTAMWRRTCPSANPVRRPRCRSPPRHPYSLSRYPRGRTNECMRTCGAHTRMRTATKSGSASSRTPSHAWSSSPCWMTSQRMLRPRQ